jgi:predicted RecA/RadA family phage recombinase
MATIGRGPSSPINVTAGVTVTSNQLVALNSLVGVALIDAASGAQLSVETEGVFDLPKEAGFAIGLGAPVYFDAADSARAEDDPALPCIGYATVAALSADTTVRVRLVPSLQPTGAVKNNLAGAARPAVTDDVTLGYTAGSTWIYQGVQWVCVDSADGAAKWRASNPLSATVTVASGAVTGTVALPTGAANGDHVQATNTTDLTNEEAITRAIATGGNVVIHMTGDPGVSTAVVTCKIWPADVG